MSLVSCRSRYLVSLVSLVIVSLVCLVDPFRSLVISLVPSRVSLSRESRHLAKRFRPSTVVGLCISTYLVSLVVDVSFPRRLSCLLLASLVS